MHESGAGKHWYFVLLASCGWWFLLFSCVFLPSCKTYLVLKTLRRSGLAPRSWCWARMGAPPRLASPALEKWVDASGFTPLSTMEVTGVFFVTGSGLKP